MSSPHLTWRIFLVALLPLGCDGQVNQATSPEADIVDSAMGVAPSRRHEVV